MSPPSKQTIVFVPGGWHNPLCFSIIAHNLRTVGYNTHYITLPSVGPSNNAFNVDFSQDVARIHSEVEKLCNQGHEILLVAHSYGGVASSEALKELDLESRQKAGLKGGVFHFFLCCSFVIPVGESLYSAGGHSDRPWYDPIPSSDPPGMHVHTPEQIFYNDMPSDEASAAISALKPWSYNCIRSKTSHAGWKDVPTTYLYCTQDQAIPYEVQKMMVENAGVKIRTETLEAGHSPFFSRPAELTAAIRKAAGEVM